VHRLHQGGRPWLDEIASVGADVVGLDWTVNLGRARQIAGDRVALQGNLDPNVLFAPDEVVAREAQAVLDSFGRPRGATVAGTATSSTSATASASTPPPERVAALVHAVHSHSRRLRTAA